MRRIGRRRVTKQKWMIVGVLSALFIFSTGYALLATRLNIRGTSQISANFNVYISSITEKEVYKATTNSTSVGQDKLTASFDVDLDVPGSYAEYTVTVKNDSDFNVELKEITGIDEANAKAPKEIQYSTSGISPGEVLAQGGTKEFTVRVDFDSDATSLPSTGKTLEIELNYEQTTASAPSIDEAKDFATDSWDTIVNAVKSGSYPYQVGDTKEIELAGLGTFNVRIANTSTPTECNTSGFSQSACGFVIEFEDIVTRRNMNSSNSNIGGWPASNMRSYLNETFLNMLPEVLKNNIKDTTTVSGHGSSESANYTSVDKIYLLSATEVYGIIPGEVDSAQNVTRQLDYYKNIGVTSSKYSGANKKESNGSIYIWWLRSAPSNNATGFHIVQRGGVQGYHAATELRGVSPAFRLR